MDAQRFIQHCEDGFAILRTFVPEMAMMKHLLHFFPTIWLRRCSWCGWWCGVHVSWGEQTKMRTTHTICSACRKEVMRYLEGMRHLER